MAVISQDHNNRALINFFFHFKILKVNVLRKRSALGFIAAGGGAVENTTAIFLEACVN